MGRDEAPTPKAAELASQLETETQDALESLRDLARGIYPPLLADKGLGAALEAQARRSLVPVTVEVSGIGRLPQEVEAAVYFSCLEALQNVTKHAEASAARVTLIRDDGHLTFEVADDGVGFDVGTIKGGTGVQGMSDRLSALDGRLDVQSAPGSGTVVSGWIPVGSDMRAP